MNFKTFVSYFLLAWKGCFINRCTLCIFSKGCSVNHVVENKCRFYQRGTALKMASDRGCSLTVKLLLESGANPNLTGMLHGKLKQYVFYTPHQKKHMFLKSAHFSCFSWVTDPNPGSCMNLGSQFSFGEECIFIHMQMRSGGSSVQHVVIVQN